MPHTICGVKTSRDKVRLMYLRKLACSIALAGVGILVASPWNTLAALPIKQQPASCEYALVIFDNAMMEYAEAPEPNSYIIVISHLGKREKRPRLNTSRLAFAKGRFKHFGFKNYVTAIGKRNSGPGTLEIYVKGRLFSSLAVEKDLAHFCYNAQGL